MKAQKYKSYTSLPQLEGEEIPSHWKPRRLRFDTRLNPKVEAVTKLDPTDEVSFLPMPAIGEQGQLDLAETRELENIGTGYTCFAEGDVVVAKITPCFENGKGALALGLTNGIAFGTTELHVLRPEEQLEARYLYYVSQSRLFRDIGEGWMYGAGGQKRVPTLFCKDFVHPNPPLKEQRAIVAFLDRQLERQDDLVEKRRELIEKLREKRSALISHTFTKGLPPEEARKAGLDPSPKLRDTRVQWLGDVPEHWVVKRLRFLLESALKYGANYPANEEDPEQTRYVRITDIDENGKLREDTFRSLPEEIAKDYLLDSNDLLFARSGATSGKTFLYEQDWGRCAFAGYLIRARFDPDLVSARFVKQFTESHLYWSWVDSTFIQSTIQNISAEKYADLPIPVPPMKEQEVIVGYLKRECGKIDKMMYLAGIAIERLTEYRSALITAAVTGQIDVREGVAGG